jgi:hypothetical protein
MYSLSVSELSLSYGSYVAAYEPVSADVEPNVAWDRVLGVWATCAWTLAAAQNARSRDVEREKQTIRIGEGGFEVFLSESIRRISVRFSDCGKRDTRPC